ncbi:MAG: hypothetical protein SPL75_02165 [Bacilli bacterium]|nr:hypothetical protein [Bacilli bacterium]
MSNEIYKSGTYIFRCLGADGDRKLVIDCVKRSLPYWVDNSFLNGFEEIDEENLLKELNVVLPSIKELSQSQLKVMHLRFGSISSCLVKIRNENERRLMMYKASLDYEVSIQTIRQRLCNYLVFQDITVLAPVTRKAKELTNDEKNFRWALNKYFYTSKKLSLKQTFKYLVREKYVDSNGKIVQNCPKFHQFRYFYYKTRSESNYIISRLGRGEYDRNYRPLLGGGVRDYFPSIGYGMLDSTIADIYLVNEEGELIGRPIITACIDAYSSMCLGYYVGWKGGSESIRKLMINVVSNKVDWCKRFGIDIKEEDWNCELMPHKVITDMGKEYAGFTFSNLANLGVEIMNLDPYRPELKSLVERFFGLIQESFKKELINKGVVLKDFGDRGATDYRKNACLTLRQFEKILILCIVHYNCGRVIDLPYGVSNIGSHAKDLWNSCLLRNKDMLIDIDKDVLYLTLLPRGRCFFKRDGLYANGLRYRAIGFTNEYLKGKVGWVAYDSNNVSHVWYEENGRYYEFELIESFFMDMSLEEALTYKNKVKDSKIINEELESEIRLSKEIEKVSSSGVGKVEIKNIRRNRKKEIKRNNL